MIKKIFLLLAFPALLFAQEQQQPQQKSQNVELPEFVITGVERVNVPTANKPKAELVPTLSTEFFKPSFSPEELPIAELSNPVRKDITFVNEASKFNGRLELGLGYYTLPMGQLTYGHSFDNGLFNGKVWGSNYRSYYKDNSGFNTAGIDLKGDFFNSYDSGFLPGTKFTVGGSFVRDSYRFFTAPDPKEQRDRLRGSFTAGLNNLLKDNLKYGLNFKESNLHLSDVSLGENIFTGNGYFETGFDGMTFGINSAFKNQNLNTLNSQSWNFLESGGFVKFKPWDNLHFAAGIYYAATEGDRSFFLTGSLTMKLSSNLTLLAEMAPYSELITITDLVYMNRYVNTNKPLIPVQFTRLYTDTTGLNRSGFTELNPPAGGNNSSTSLQSTAAATGQNNTLTNIFVDNKFNLKGALKYEYNKFFEIDGGFKFVDYNNFPYFVPSEVVIGKFDVMTTKAKRFTGFMNFLFHPGPFGIFYGDLQIEHFYDSKNNNIPYNPGLKADLSYEYDFGFGLKTQSHLTFATSTWADVPNHTRIDPYLNLGIKLGVEAAANFDVFAEFQNLLNQNNYIWYGYKEKPLDVIFGIDYRF